MGTAVGVVRSSGWSLREPEGEEVRHLARLSTSTQLVWANGAPRACECRALFPGSSCYAILNWGREAGMRFLAYFTFGGNERCSGEIS